MRHSFVDNAAAADDDDDDDSDDLDAADDGDG